MAKKQVEQNEFYRGFNVVKEDSDFNYKASRRVEISRVWAKRLLRASFYLMLASSVLVGVALVLVKSKPEPLFYASTPSGNLAPLGKAR